VVVMPLTQVTWQDVQQFPDDGKRYEAIEGELYVTAAPSLRHQAISMRLTSALLKILVEGSHGTLWAAPTGVEFPSTGEGVEPDLVFVSNERRGILSPKWIRGAPDLVIEILSPSTASRDLKLKLRLYERQGVGEYWVVDPDEDDVTAWRFDSAAKGTTPVLGERHTDRLPVRVGDEVVGEIALSEIFRRG